MNAQAPVTVTPPPPGTMTVVMSDGEQVTHTEPVIALRTSTKAGAAMIAAPFAALLTLMPFYGTIDMYVQQICTSSDGATRAMVIAGLTWLITAVPGYIIARITKSPLKSQPL